MWIVAIAALLTGFFGALTGVVGDALPPALTETAGVPIDRAIGTAKFAPGFSAPVAAHAAVRRVRLSAGAVTWLCVAAAFGSVAGSVTLAWFSGSMLSMGT